MDKRINEPIVFVPQIPAKKGLNGDWVEVDWYQSDKLLEFGRPEVVWSSKSAGMLQAEMERIALKTAEYYVSDRDYLVAIGSPTLIGLLGWAIGWRGKRVRLLEWSKQSGRYKIQFSQKG